MRCWRHLTVWPGQCGFDLRYRQRSDESCGGNSLITVDPVPALKSSVNIAISDDIIAYPRGGRRRRGYRYYAPVTFAGAAPGSAAGLFQINFQIPPGVKPAVAVPLHIRLEWPAVEQALTIAIDK